MKHMILAAAVALALTGPAEAGSRLSAEECSVLNTQAHLQARSVIASEGVLRMRLRQQRAEFDKKWQAGENYKNPGLEKLIRNAEENLRDTRATAVEYSTIWRNLCKD